MSFFYVQAYWVVRERYNQTPELAIEIEHLKEQLGREQFRRVLQAEQSESFRQEVAAALPVTLRPIAEKAKDYPLRNLASVTRSGNKESLQVVVASTVFETGKALFRKGEYQRANRMFDKLISEYGYSSQVVEAHFLKAEGQYLAGDLEGANETINKMVELFPESELTGFALVRLGQIFENRERYDEAVQIYRTVLKTFPYRNVAAVAAKNLRHMEP
ncbi:MAG: tol-pal system YbgF family protein [Bdellovibrionales bacterium]